MLHARTRNLAADRAATVAASVANMYTDQASEELRAWTARQILDALVAGDIGTVRCARNIGTGLW